MNASLEKLDVLLICGNYATGKSTLANKYFRSWKRVNRNEIRRFLKSMMEHGAPEEEADFSPEMEHLVHHIELTIIKYLLEKNEKVLIDNTSVTRKSRKRYVQEVQRFGKSIGCVFIDAPVQLLLQRNAARPKAERVPESVISQLHAKHEHPRKDEGFSFYSMVDAEKEKR